MENMEIIKTIVSCAALKLNNKEFIGCLVKELSRGRDMKNLTKDELLTLARSFVIYVR
jgi:hypothetical protein